MWHNAGSYQRGKGTVLTWIISIARYRALDLMRHHKVRNETPLDDDDHHANENSNIAASELTHPKLNECMDELDTLLAERPDQPSALLLQTNVQLNQGDPGLARQTCLLEANMQLSPSTHYYWQLHNISEKFPAASTKVALWVNEVLADLALFANEPAIAINHIEQQPDSEWPVSSWVT